MQKEKTKNTDNLINSIDNKRVMELPSNLKKVMQIMFGTLTSDCFYASKKEEGIVTITHGNQSKTMLCFFGNSPIVVNDEVNEFETFLKSLGVSKRTRLIFLFYHYGITPKASNDGKPYNKEQLVNIYGLYLKEANIELNQREILVKIIERITFYLSKEKIDYFYVTNTSRDVIYRYERLMHYFTKFGCIDDVGPIHFGNLIYEPISRKGTSKNYLKYRITWRDGF